jgi:hypothetical protein
MNGQRVTPLGCMNIAVPPSGPVGLTAGIVNATTHFVVPATAGLALIVCEGTAGVRWRDDGVAPGTSTGMLITPTSPLTYTGDLGQLQFLSASGTIVLDIAVYQQASAVRIGERYTKDERLTSGTADGIGS